MKLLKKYINIYYIHSLSLPKKILLLLTIAISLILSSSLFLGLDVAYRSFTEPSSIPDAKDLNSIGMTISTISLSIAGVFFFAILITIFQEWFLKKTKELENGKLIFQEKNHIMIFNYSKILWHILESINQTNLHQKQNVLILLQKSKKSLKAHQEIKNTLKRYYYNNLNIYIKIDDFETNKALIESNIHKSKATIILSSNKLNSHTSKSDQKQLRLISSLFGFKEYKSLLSTSLFNKKPYKLIIQNQGSYKFKQTLDLLTKSNQTPLILSVQSRYFTNKLLSVAMLDNQYLSLFKTIIKNPECSVEYIDPKTINATNLSFIDVYMTYTNFVAIGISSYNKESHDFKITLNPFYLTSIDQDTWIIALKTDPNPNLAQTIDQKNNTFANSFSDTQASNFLFSEKKNKKVLICGEHNNYSFLDKYLDEESIKEKQTLPTLKEFFEANPTLLSSFDTIILNFSKFSTFKAYIHIASLNIKKSKIIVSIPDEKTYYQFKKYERTHNINCNIVYNREIEGHLLAKFSQKRSTFFILDELLDYRGSEFYLLDPSDVYGNSMRQKMLSIAKHDSLLLGYIDTNDKVVLSLKEADSTPKKYIVLSKGEY